MADNQTREYSLGKLRQRRVSTIAWGEQAAPSATVGRQPSGADPAASDIALVHLVWKPLGLEPFGRFISSYRRNPGGAKHRLVLVFNGFDTEEELNAYRELMDGLQYEILFVSPPTQDIPAYFRAARHFHNRYLCFVNSHSVLLDEFWLAKLYGQITHEDVGLVGATGSWASHRSGILFERGKPSPYTAMLTELRRRRGPRPHQPAIFQLSDGLARSLKSAPLLTRLALTAYYYIVVRSYYLIRHRLGESKARIKRYLADLRKERVFNARNYQSFPTPHLRTNAFMIRRDLMLRLQHGNLRKKEDAYRFESGRLSLTNQVAHLGLKVLVIGRDGRAYDEKSWPESQTFFQGEQENLLVADNQTREYSLGKLKQRRVLSTIAWGERAAPSAIVGRQPSGADPAAADIALVHLVWKPLGLEPFERFISSYRRHPGGAKHRLVLVFNGFDTEEELNPYRELMAGLQYEILFVSPPTQDIPAYFQAARRCHNRYLCFVNSHSVLLDEDWLAKLYGQITHEDVGLVGATGSWASHSSIARWDKGLRSEYDECMADIEAQHRQRQRLNRAALFGLSAAKRETLRRMPLARRLIYSTYYYGFVRAYYVVTNSVRYDLERRRDMRERLRRFPASEFGPHPSPHLRTNAFMISRELMLDLEYWEMPTKDDAYRFESGRNGLTNQIVRKGLKVLVVGRDGRGYEEDEWPLSHTLWQGEQENLLVADNNTSLYSSADESVKVFLSRFAWGTEAECPPFAT